MLVWTVSYALCNRDLGILESLLYNLPLLLDEGIIRPQILVLLRIQHQRINLDRETVDVHALVPFLPNQNLPPHLNHQQKNPKAGLCLLTTKQMIWLLPWSVDCLHLLTTIVPSVSLPSVLTKLFGRALLQFLLHHNKGHRNIVGHLFMLNVFVHGQIKVWNMLQKLGELEANLIKPVIGVVLVVKLNERLFQLDIGMLF